MLQYTTEQWNKLFKEEVHCYGVKSSGPGGQNVNKVNTKVVLRWDVSKSTVWNKHPKALERFQKHNKNVINKSGVLHLACDANRSQFFNRMAVEKSLRKRIKLAFIVPPERKEVKPSKSTVKKRLDKKTKHSLKKKRRYSDKHVDLD